MAGFILLYCSFTIPAVGTEVQKFQSLITAVVASVAAATAYEGAMSKIAFERAAEERKLDRERLNLMVKLQYSLGRLVIEIRQTIKTLEEFQAKGTLIFSRAATPECPPELRSAWDRLDLLPANAIGPLSIIILATELSDFGEVVENSGSNSMRDQKMMAAGHLKVISEAHAQGEKLLTITEATINKLQKRVGFE
ncbi:MAG: hypothetical protein WBB98_13440 [Xanthobacteraceae bacterium]